MAVVDENDKYAMVRSAAPIKHSQANVDSNYLSLTLRPPHLQTQIERNSKQSTQANLFIEPICRLVVVHPTTEVTLRTGHMGDKLPVTMSQTRKTETQPSV